MVLSCILQSITRFLSGMLVFVTCDLVSVA
jgi:hypothetical protein